MGARGPRPTPTAIKKKRGAQHRSKHDREPKPTKAKAQTPAPSQLRPKARAVWREVIAILECMGVMTEAEKKILFRYCQTWVRWSDAADFVNEHGPTVELVQWDPNAKPAKGKEPGAWVTSYKERPESRLEGRCATLLLGMERELGLTPSARTRIEVDERGPQPVGRPSGTKKDRETKPDKPFDVRKGPRLKTAK